MIASESNPPSPFTPIKLVSPFARAARLFRTVRYLRWNQVYRRLWRTAVQAAEPWLPPPSLPAALNEIELRPIRHALRESRKTASVKAPGEYVFLNKAVLTGGSWEPVEDLLWLFNLHYFDYVFEIDPQEFASLVEDWIEKNPYPKPPGWHPFPTSQRICNWIWRYSMSPEDYNDPFRELFTRSLLQQLRHLARRIELDLLGNHVITNCKGLVVGGVFLNQERELGRGLQILKEQLGEQILSDGGHYERSPMYHSLVLEDLLAVHMALAQAARPVPPWLEEGVLKMARFLDAVTVEDRIPLLNDSSSEIALPPRQLLAFIEQRVPGFEFSPKIQPLMHLKDTGLFIHKTPELSVVFDVGRIGPDFQPGHAHNDTLSFCLWLNSIPVVTDSGVFEYAPGPWRDYFRSARAHNTVIIDGVEPNEVWRSFRVGARGYPVDVRGDGVSGQAGHDCYKKRGVLVFRKLELLPEGSGIVLHDRIEAKNEVGWESFLHLAPGAEIHSTTSGPGRWAWCGSVTGQDFSIVVESDGSIKGGVMTSWYSSEFGRKEERPCLKLSGRALKGVTKWKAAIVKGF